MLTSYPPLDPLKKSPVPQLIDAGKCIDTWIASLPSDFVAELLMPTFALLRRYTEWSTAHPQAMGVASERLSTRQLAELLAFTLIALESDCERVDKKPMHGRILEFVFAQHFGGHNRDQP